MYDVWADPDYDFAETKAERLLLAGARLFDAEVRRVCGGETAALGFPQYRGAVRRTIVYIPIGQLSPVTMKKIRVVHVLDGYDKRESAKEFIW